MVLPAYIANKNVKLKVNVMLGPCSTGSYVTENAAEELRLQGHSKTLTISGTGGTETLKQSRRVTLSVCSIEGGFSAQLQANVLDDIASDTPAFEWSELKTIKMATSSTNSIRHRITTKANRCADWKR